MLGSLEGQPRLVLRAELEPVAGSSFQPTGFPDLGAAEFDRLVCNGSDGTGRVERSLLVESVQSLTNHLEALGWDAAANRPVPVLEKLPYVEVVSAGDQRFLTSSRLEPHRLAAAYVKDAVMDGEKAGTWLGERLHLETGRPLDWGTIYQAIYELDPLCLIHGVFFSDKQWHGNPKVRRALSASIEAHDVRPLVSGGLKRDDVSFKAGEGRGAEQGYGFVPFGRTEYTAREVVLTASVDLEQIRGYGLGEGATQLLVAVTLWELSTLISKPLRLRTACDLEVRSMTIRRPDGLTELPSPESLEAEIKRLAPSFDRPGARTVEYR